MNAWLYVVNPDYHNIEMYIMLSHAHVSILFLIFKDFEKLYVHIWLIYVEMYLHPKYKHSAYG